MWKGSTGRLVAAFSIRDRQTEAQGFGKVAVAISSYTGASLHQIKPKGCRGGFLTFDQLCCVPPSAVVQF